MGVRVGVRVRVGGGGGRASYVCVSVCDRAWKVWRESENPMQWWERRRRGLKDGECLTDVKEVNALRPPSTCQKAGAACLAAEMITSPITVTWRNSAW